MSKPIDVSGQANLPYGPWELTIPAELDRDRLDRAITTLLSKRGAEASRVSRSQIERAIDEGRISKQIGEVDAVRWEAAKTSKQKVRAGEIYRVQIVEAHAGELSPEPVDFEVLHVDEDIIVVVKPAGLVVHPAPGHEHGTLVHGLLHRFGQLAQVEVSQPDLPFVEEDDDAMAAESTRYIRPGIVHRLDKDTSGVMVVARTMFAKEQLQKVFAAHDLERSYVAIAVGKVSSQRIETLHGRHPTDRKRFSGKVRTGKTAVTEIEALESFEQSTLIRCRLHTGRTHQIRVHLSELNHPPGHPLLGDVAYGGVHLVRHKPLLHRLALQLGRQALHAEVLGFRHPRTGEAMRFVATVPEDMRAVIEALREGV